MKTVDLINLPEAGGCLTSQTKKTAGKTLKILTENDYC